MIDVKLKKKNLFNTSYIEQPNVPSREEYHRLYAHPVVCDYDYDGRRTLKDEATRVVSDYKFSRLGKSRKNNAGNWLKEHDNNDKTATA